MGSIGPRTMASSVNGTIRFIAGRPQERSGADYTMRPDGDFLLATVGPGRGARRARGPHHRGQHLGQGFQPEWLVQAGPAHLPDVGARLRVHRVAGRENDAMLEVRPAGGD